MYLQKAKNKLFKTNCSLLPLPKDSRDLKLGFWFGRKYEPKNEKLELAPFRTHSQFYNTCGWTASTGAKEIDEQIVLSPRSLIIRARMEGKISGDGFSNLRDNEKMVSNFGISEKKLLVDSNSNWTDYSNRKYLTSEIINNATKHRSESYWSASNIADIYKALDEGHPVKIGIRWYSGFNMSNGFKAPWIIGKNDGWYVGGHAMYIFGYDMDYHGKKVFKIKNSFGQDWGDNGNCYITTDYLEPQIKRYGAFANIDMTSDVSKFVVDNDGKNIKAKDDSAVYHLQKGQKKVYPDEISYFAFNTSWDGIITTEKNTLDLIPDGDQMDIEKSQYWKFIKHLKAPQNLYRLIDIYLKN